MVSTYVCTYLRVTVLTHILLYTCPRITEYLCFCSSFIQSICIFSCPFFSFSNTFFALVFILLPLSIFISISFTFPVFLLSSLPFSLFFLLSLDCVFSRSYISRPFFISSFLCLLFFHLFSTLYSCFS